MVGRLSGASPFMIPAFPRFETNDATLNRAYRIAIGDIVGNIAPDAAGLLETPGPCFRAGLDYPQQWTRDNAINTWNGGGLLFPEVARNSLLAVLARTEGGVRITGEYWDSIIWAQGAWAYYLYTGDEAFLALARDTVVNTLRFFERTEFDAAKGLFRGGALIQDGVAAYPDRYAAHGTGAIKEWPAYHPQDRAKTGEGLPIMALSTNCLYLAAYRLLPRMNAVLKIADETNWDARADALETAIRKELWNPATGTFRFFVDPWGGCDRQEGVGHALAILSGVATPEQRDSVFARQTVMPAGLPCVWPSYERYTKLTRAEEEALPEIAWSRFARFAVSDAGAFGRHSGVVWPPLQAFWAEAAARHGRADLLGHEVFALARHACRDRHFSEIYHPITGEEYGGVQETPDGRGLGRWNSCERQTWSATGYLRMVLSGLCGLEFAEEGVHARPVLPEGIEIVELAGLKYRDAVLSLKISRGARSCRVNGEPAPEAFVSATARGAQVLEIVTE